MRLLNNLYSISKHREELYEEHGVYYYSIDRENHCCFICNEIKEVGHINVVQVHNLDVQWDGLYTNNLFLHAHNKPFRRDVELLYSSCQKCYLMNRSWDGKDEQLYQKLKETVEKQIKLLRPFIKVQVSANRLWEWQ